MDNFKGGTIQDIVIKDDLHLDWKKTRKGLCQTSMTEYFLQN